VQQVSAVLRRLEGAVGDGDKEADRGEVASPTRQVDLVPESCQAALEGWQADLDAAREDPAHIKAKIIG
jgi:hypothetical protein